MLPETEKKESKKVKLDKVRSRDVHETMEMLVRSKDVSVVRKGLVKASDVEQARKVIDTSKAKEKKKQ